MVAKTDFKTKYVKTHFGHLAYHQIEAKNNEFCIFVHGHMDSGLDRFSYRLIEDFEGAASLILLDSRGHGSSTRLENYPSLKERGEDLKILVQHLIENHNPTTVTLISYSIASGIILNVLSEVETIHSSTKFKAVLVAPLLKLSKHKEWFKENIKTLKNTSANFIQKVYRSKGIFNINRDYFKDLSVNFYRKNASKIKSKLSIVFGEQDNRTSVADVLRFKNEILPKAKVYSYKSLGHVFNEKEYALISKKISQIA